MAKLNILTSLHSVVLVGEFNGWDIDTAKRVDLKPGHKFITVDLPVGEYRVLSCRSWQAGGNLSNGRQTDAEPLQNRTR